MFYDKALEISVHSSFANDRLLNKMQKAKKKFENETKHHKEDEFRRTKVGRLRT